MQKPGLKSTEYVVFYSIFLKPFLSRLHSWHGLLVAITCGYSKLWCSEYIQRHYL